MKKKIELMKKMEAKGLGFTANVIMNGCSKPVTKMAAILALLEVGYDVRQAQFETTALVIDGVMVCFGRLDVGALKLAAELKEHKAARTI